MNFCLKQIGKLPSDEPFTESLALFPHENPLPCPLVGCNQNEWLKVVTATSVNQTHIKTCLALSSPPNESQI